MHLDADHALFFERHQPLWRAAGSLALTMVVLVTNAGARSASVSVLGAGAGAVLLVMACVRGHRRLAPALAWLVGIVIVALLAGGALSGDPAIVVDTAVRVMCGVLWVLWLGTQVDWASLRQILLGLRVPSRVVATLDHALMHGVFTKREWTQRRDAARLRLGTARLPLATWSTVLGEGALQAFFRVEHVEENALLRSSRVADGDAGASPLEASPLEGGDADQLGCVRLEAVDVERTGASVLQELELRLARAEWLLLCGPSGAGKSSLLRLLAGLDGPSRGTMTRLGTPVGPGAPLRARLDGRVALLAQNPEHHFIASTVAEDIAWGLLRRGVASHEARRRSQEMAEAVRVDHLLERPCHALSFGEQRRVALAGLLVLEPALLLLDEPTAGLDPVSAHELRRLVEQSVGRTGGACVWATHYLHSLPVPATRVVLLRDGRILFDGPTEEGLSQPWLVQAGLAVPQQEADEC